jgi:hypothetical protein
MAAREMFESFTAALPEREKEMLRDLIAARRVDMLASRSEEARLRVAEEFLREARAVLPPQKK